MTVDQCWRLAPKTVTIAERRVRRSKRAQGTYSVIVDVESYHWGSWHESATPLRVANFRAHVALAPTTLDPLLYAQNTYRGVVMLKIA